MVSGECHNFSSHPTRKRQLKKNPPNERPNLAIVGSLHLNQRMRLNSIGKGQYCGFPPILSGISTKYGHVTECTVQIFFEGWSWDLGLSVFDV